MDETKACNSIIQESRTHWIAQRFLDREDKDRRFRLTRSQRGSERIEAPSMAFPVSLQTIRHHQ